jgi:hypothetical protein
MWRVFEPFDDGALTACQLWAMNLEVVKGFHGGMVFHC